MQQDYTPNPSAWSKDVSTRATNKYSLINTDFPNTDPPSRAELDSLRESLQPHLQTRLEASWAATGSPTAREKDQAMGEQTDFFISPDLVEVTVQVPLRRFERREDESMRERFGDIAVTGLVVQGWARSVFDPQTRTWTAIR